MDEGTSDEKRQAAGREILRHHSNLLAFILPLVRDFDLAHAVLSEVLTALGERAGDFEPGAAFGAWAAPIVRKKTLESCLQKGREVALSPTAIDGIQKAWEADPDPGWLEVLRACLAEIRGKTRSVLNMRYRDGLSGAQIARRTKCTVPAVLRVLYRARSTLGSLADSRSRPGGDTG